MLPVFFFFVIKPGRLKSTSSLITGTGRWPKTGFVEKCGRTGVSSLSLVIGTLGSL